MNCQQPIVRRAAFTLIELLIVVAIIAVLAGIAVPRFTSMRDRAETAQCQGNLRAVFVGLTAYKADYNRYPVADGTAGDEPSPGQTTFGEGPAANGSWSGVPLMLSELGYLQDPAAYYCPTMRKLMRGRAKYFRYAYNAAAIDVGGFTGGIHNIETDIADIWMARCVYLHSDYTFTPDEKYTFPHEGRGSENVLFADGRVVTEEAAE